MSTRKEQTGAWSISLLLHGAAAAGLACAVWVSVTPSFVPAQVVLDIQGDQAMKWEGGGPSGGAGGAGDGGLRATAGVEATAALRMARSSAAWSQTSRVTLASLTAEVCDVVALAPAEIAAPRRKAAVPRGLLPGADADGAEVASAGGGEGSVGAGGWTAGDGGRKGWGSGGGAGGGTGTGSRDGTGSGSGTGGTGVGANTQPAVIGLTKPAYPLLSRERGETGDVLLAVSVQADGSRGPVQLVRSSGYTRLDRAAMTALERARFVPALRNGQPVASVKEVLISFRLEDGES